MDKRLEDTEVVFWYDVTFIEINSTKCVLLPDHQMSQVRTDHILA